MIDSKWYPYFIEIAKVVRTKSKDPSSQIGVVIVGPDNEIRSTGYNGFPRGVLDLAERWTDRPTKYKYVEHAERNAIYNAARCGIGTKGCSMFMVAFGPPTTPCIECAKAVIQAGIIEVVGWPLKPADAAWHESQKFSLDMLTEAGVRFVEVPNVT